MTARRTQSLSIPKLPKLGRHILSIDYVRQFHETYGHPVAKELNHGDAKLRRLRVKLIADELAELAQALGVPLQVTVSPFASDDSAPRKDDMNGMRRDVWVAPAELCYADENVDLVETADALADLDYVVQGGNLVFGIPAGLVMEEVHYSNMSKLGSDGKPIIDEDGKVVKGPNFREPDIRTILTNFDASEEL